MKINKLQAKALLRKWKQSDQGMTFLQFRRSIQSGYDCIMIQWRGMWLSIELDGYTRRDLITNKPTKVSIMKTDIRSTGEYQSKVDTFVNKEVLTSANELIQALNASDDMREGKYFQELINLTGSNDYEEPAIYAIENATNYSFNTLNDFIEWTNQDDIKTAKELIAYLSVNFVEFCEYFEIESYFTNVLEHWIVSDNLARHLRENDQVVVDIYGLTIWGRFTSGQAISMDSVICDIYDKVNS